MTSAALPEPRQTAPAEVARSLAGDPPLPTAPGIVVGGRRLSERYMLDRCKIADVVRVRDATGGWTESYVERTGDPLRCRWGAVTDAEAVEVGASTEGKALKALTLPVGIVVEEGAQVRNLRTDQLHRVVANKTPDSVMVTSVRLLVREL
jgi:hypothetical protein